MQVDKSRKLHCSSHSAINFNKLIYISKAKIMCIHITNTPLALPYTLPYYRSSALHLHIDWIGTDLIWCFFSVFGTITLRFDLFVTRRLNQPPAHTHT